MSLHHLDNVASMDSTPSLPMPISQDSVDPAETVDSIIQQDLDVVFGKFADTESNRSAGSLLQQDEVRRILLLPGNQRAPEDIMMVSEVMSKTSFAVGMQRSLLDAVARNVRLVTVQKGSTVMREGGSGDHMFIIATGTCIVIKADKKGRKRALRSLTVGQSFGELALQEAGGKRAATVTASEDCDLLALDGFEYRTVLAQHHRQELDSRVELLMRLPVFKGLSPRVLRDVAQLMERRTYQVGSFIFQQGDEAECLYVLTTGAVRIVRQMTVPRSFAAKHKTDPITLQMLDPTRAVEERYQPIPERAIRNGRPRSYLLPKAKDQGLHQQPGHLVNRPQSAATAPPGTRGARPNSSPRLRAALKALRQPKRSMSARPMSSGYDEERKMPPPAPPDWAVVGRPPWNAGGGFKADGTESAFPSAPKFASKPLLQRPKTAQARFCIITKGKDNSNRGAKDVLAQRSFENFQDPFENTQGSPQTPRPHSAGPESHHRHSSSPQSSLIREQVSDVHSQEYAATAQKQRPSTACASVRSTSTGRASSKRDTWIHSMAKCATPSVSIMDPSKQQIPGLEMSDVTAEQLDEAGMLYTDEQRLLQSSEGESGVGSPGGHKHVSGGKKPPLGRGKGSEDKHWRRKASSIAVKAVSGLNAWIELSTLEGPDYFGEAAMLSRGVRHATVIADSNVEILVLTKVDFDLKIDRDARDVVGILVSNYPKDKQILRSMEQEAKWELFKRETVQQVLVDVGKADRLRWYSSQLFSKAWKP